jgi:hypothetical protein
MSKRGQDEPLVLPASEDGLERGHDTLVEEIVTKLSDVCSHLQSRADRPPATRVSLTRTVLDTDHRARDVQGGVVIITQVVECGHDHIVCCCH